MYDSRRCTLRRTPPTSENTKRSNETAAPWPVRPALIKPNARGLRSQERALRRALNHRPSFLNALSSIRLTSKRVTRDEPPRRKTRAVRLMGAASLVTLVLLSNAQSLSAANEFGPPSYSATLGCNANGDPHSAHIILYCEGLGR